MSLLDRVKNMNMTQYLVTAYVVSGIIVTVAMAVRGVPVKLPK